MNDLDRLVKKAKRLDFQQLVAATALSTGTVSMIINRKNTNPRLHTYAQFKHGVDKLTKRQRRRKADKKQSRSRDKTETAQAKTSAE